jgi:hypothetical protein
MSPDGSTLFSCAGERVTLFNMVSGRERWWGIEKNRLCIFDSGKELSISDDGDILTIVRYDGSEVRYNVGSPGVAIFEVGLKVSVIDYLSGLLELDFDEGDVRFLSFTDITYDEDLIGKEQHIRVYVEVDNERYNVKAIKNPYIGGEWSFELMEF